MLRVAVIGVGSLGQHHARVYSQMKEQVELIGVADLDEGQAKSVASKCKCAFFKDARQLLGKVDAVSIAVPTRFHFEVASVFLNAGVHCLVEKPMTTDLSEADRLLEIAREKKALLQVGHIERFNPAILALKAFKTEPLFIEADRLGPYSPRNIDTSVVLELMIHDLDIVLDMVDRPVESVHAVGVPVLSPTEDIANVRLTFEGGCVANVTASRVTMDKQRKIRIFSKEAYFSVDYLSKQVKVYRLKEGTDATQAHSMMGLAKMVQIETLKIKDEEQLKLELESFIEAVREGKRPVVSGQQGREAVALSLEIQRQIEEHRKKVLG
jgi:predicted dehydrogenase